MGKAEIYNAIKDVVPCVHMTWREGSAPELPWAVYYLDISDSLFSDNTRYANVNKWVVELYQVTCNEEIEKALEEALTVNFGGFSKAETWVATEHCVLTTYIFTEIERTENGQS